MIRKGLEKRDPAPANSRKTIRIIVDGKTYTYHVHRKRPYAAGYVRERPATVTKDGKTRLTKRRKTAGAKSRDKAKRAIRKAKAKQLSLF